MAKGFASTGDMKEKNISFTEVGENLYAFTAEGDPNTGVIIGDDSVMIVDAQAIAQGVYGMFDDDERAICAFGMLPAEKMNSLEKLLGEKIETDAKNECR